MGSNTKWVAFIREVNMDPVLLYAVLALFVVILSLITYIRWNYGFLESLGIPVEPPTLLFGSCPDIYLKYPHFEDIKRFQKYGSVFGVSKQDLCSGLEGFLYDKTHWIAGLWRQIPTDSNCWSRTSEAYTCAWLWAFPEQVGYRPGPCHFQWNSWLSSWYGTALFSKFSYAISRLQLYKLWNNIIPVDDRWKAVRSMLSPPLTATRLKHVMGVMNEVTEEFVDGISNECIGERVKIDLRKYD